MSKDREPEYKSWEQMIQRCENPNATRYERYGGRGIKVCDKWRGSYELFLADVGRRPSIQHTLDRINNDGNYEPGNCKWSTRREQAANTAASLKTSCIAGHEYMVENTYIDRKGYRRCRRCHRERMKNVRPEHRGV